MGFNGLWTQLSNAGAKPRVVSLQNGEADGRPDNLMLVDMSSVVHYLLSRILDGNLKSISFHTQLYHEACRYFGGLQRSGLRCVLFVDSAAAPRHELSYIEAKGKALVTGVLPTAALVVSQASSDLGMETIRSVHSADGLLLAWAHRHSEALFAVLSGNSDFLVYGVSKIAHPHDVVIDLRCVSLHVWDTEGAWCAWHMAAVGAAGAYMPPLLRRAQVAAVLGNIMNREGRRRLLQRRADTSASVAAPVVSPSLVARAVVRLPSSVSQLDLNFFRKPPISLANFDQDDLTQINGPVREFLSRERAARDGSALRDLTLTETSLPWLEPAVARRMAAASGPLPGFLLELACRGLATPEVEDSVWQQMRSLRCIVAKTLLGGSGGRATGNINSYEYEPAAKRLHRLTAAAAETPPPAGSEEAQSPVAAHLSASWFRPEVYLPDVPIAESGADEAPEATQPLPQRQSTLQETVAQLRDAQPELPEPMAVLYALMLHCADPDPAAWDEREVRDVLLPGVPLRQGATPPVAVSGTEGEEQEVQEEEVSTGDVRNAARAAIIDVGSALSADDWNDIDDKDVVGKVRSGGAYKLLREIQPWDQLAAARGRSGAAAVGGSTLFALARRALEAGPGSPEWVEAQRTWSSARLKDRQQALADMWSSANRWAASAAGAPMRHRHQQELLDLVDEHLRAAARQPQRLRRRPMHIILSTPTGSGKTFTAVMMHMHVLRDRERVMTAAGRTAGGPASSRGGASGGGVAGEDRPGHPETILVYSVPTKQVLKRVGQECEAHGVVYWTAARDGSSFQVRRPYSIRTRRGERGSTGAGRMQDQLKENALRGATHEDLGGGKPDVIIADIYATAALVQAAAEAHVDDFYHSSKLVLYFDEPNMGIHLDKEVRQVVRQILAFAPPTTILASATLPFWDELPAWWKGSGATGASHVVITQEPYELPMCRLSVLDDVSGQQVLVSPLELFDDASQLGATLERNPRARVLLLRYFSPDYANQLLGLEAAAEAPAPAASGTAAIPEGGVLPRKASKGERVGRAATSEGGAARPGREQAAEGEQQQQDDDDGVLPDDTWKVLDQDVRGLRSEMLEPELLRLASEPERFQELREAWRQPPAPASGDIRDVLSKQGVTLVATLEPQSLALQLAGKSADPKRWEEEGRAVRAKVRDAAAAKRSADKARERAAKRGDEDGGRAGRHDDGLSGAGRVTLRPGLTVWADEADEADNDTLVMLSKGVAYTSSQSLEPLVKRLYQQALLYVPERAGVRPPLHTLVVDYSAVYGTDCPAVDTIVLCADLAAHLSFEDHQQFMGRLRRDGTVVYPSMDMLRRAVLGGSPQQWAEQERRRAEQHRQQIEEVLVRHIELVAVPAGSDATKMAARELLRLVRPGQLSRADVACVVLTAALRSLVEQQSLPCTLPGDAAATIAAAAGSDATKLCAAALRRLAQWGTIKPMKLLEYLKLIRPAEQRRLVCALEELCVSVAGDSGAAAAAASGTLRFLPCAPKLLQTLADEDLLEKEALTEWIEAAAAAEVQAGGAAAAATPGSRERAVAFRRAVTAVRDWLQDESEEEEEA